ncbi:hypothetical protein BDF22DRAFT_695492 [Syncephalis plumigaleata]|nr:hypothetical protein BDF22DRAFT_695492 [Syncephalis plumigaleata]
MSAYTIADTVEVDIDMEEAFEFPNLPVNKSDTAAPDASSSHFVNAMLAASTGNLTLTENASVTYASTTSARLDFFFDIISGSDRTLIREELGKSWQEDPLDTLKLIFQLRDIRDGKGDRTEFYHALQWLYQHHPKTLIANLAALPEIGYWKDLAEFLLWETIDYTGINELNESYKQSQEVKGKRYEAEVWKQKNLKRKARREEFRAANPDADEATITRERDEKEAREKRDKTTAEKRANDSQYRQLHIEVARLFAVALQQDVSLAAKWAPTPRAHHDRHTLLATTIAQLLYPEEECRKQGEELASYVMRVRIQYQREYLTPLRAKIHVVETMMSHNQWDKIVYEQVPSVCMKKQKRLFTKHDNERFSTYLEQVEKGEKKIASKALMPHELVEEAFKYNMQVRWGGDNAANKKKELEQAIKVMEAQWRSYVDDLAKEGNFESTMAVCDVSGSMNGTPMHAAIALSLLITELTKAPFDQILITFSEDPKIHHVEGDTFLDRVENVSRMEFGLTTSNNVQPEQMVKRLFVFSDMEFNQASTGGMSAFNTDYAIIERKFKEAGYPVPEMIFWNLRGEGRAAHGASKPVTVGQTNIGMLSGFSGQLLKLFLKGKIEEMNGFAVLREALDIEKYERLVIID